MHAKTENIKWRIVITNNCLLVIAVFLIVFDQKFPTEKLKRKDSTSLLVIKIESIACWHRHG